MRVGDPRRVGYQHQVAGQQRFESAGAGDRGFSTGLDVEDALTTGVASPSLDEDGRVAPWGIATGDPFP
ncbi:hypothetical protein [Actinomadura sp. 3N407]|uniref:hypothetical protein n=1 Tax=Actinomadura sp. 3N407 TaxID=3457423 RepID=UPI003FCDDB35